MEQFKQRRNMILNGDAVEMLKTLPDESINCCVTSPPYYGLRDYGVDGQIGNENTMDEYVKNLVNVFREVKRTLKSDGTLWLNLGDTYLNKQLSGMPWKVAFALQEDGWKLRQDIIWNKPNAMPESVKDRCTKSHEYIFLLSKTQDYFYDSEAIREENKDKYNGKRGTTKTRKKMQSAMREKSDAETMTRYSTQGRNKRSVWSQDERVDFIKNVSDELECYGIDGEVIGTALLNSLINFAPDVWDVSTKSFRGAHFAVFPPELIRPCILAGCQKNGTVLDPFFGSGTTGEVAIEEGRNYIGIELNKEYIQIAESRLSQAKAKII